ncbi:aminopeptidase P family N-terminal domain-containing protein, partial [Arthrobacter sp. H5]|uniref:aminopeptidase P family N-terminal domain-containing protein n=1 Tax=Arthrobacter sp. H5 TaxID=1267973 RepID=UPI000561DA22
MTLDIATRWDQQLQSLQQLARRLGVDTMVLKDPLNLSWFTGARWHVPQTLNLSCFDVVVEGLRGGSPGVRVVTNTIEAPRLRDTELAGTDAVFDVVGWAEDRAARLPKGPTVAADHPLDGCVDAAAELAALRRVLNTDQRRRLANVS